MLVSISQPGRFTRAMLRLEVPNGHEEAGRLAAASETGINSPPLGLVAEGWFLSACEANLSGEDINATGLADFLYTLGLAIEDTGLAAFLQVSSQDQVTLTGLMQNFSSASVVVPNATLLEVINNLTQNDTSLSLGELFDQLSGMGESLQAQEGVNFEQVSSLLQALQALNALGLDQSTVQSLLGSMALGSLGLGPFAALSGLSLPTNFLSDPSQILQAGFSGQV
ncbi:unnamed protein product [Effrenium voratum]|uniref:Uncharacterized protein n=1 Tax=Effrenium voratum TaxID=2562239 RepID=A0AA36HMZ2_9DINO|nr:unnamed protein product [Effrenium voratum]